MQTPETVEDTAAELPNLKEHSLTPQELALKRIEEHATMIGRDSMTCNEKWWYCGKVILGSIFPLFCLAVIGWSYYLAFGEGFYIHLIEAILFTAILIFVVYYFCIRKEM